MKFTLFVLMFLIAIKRSTEKRHRKVSVSSNSSDVQHVNIACPNYRRYLKDSEGFIKPINNTFFEIIYRWSIEVPQHHDILLTFSWPNEELSRNETSHCENCKPYFEIIYGYSSSESTFKIEKFYNIRKLTNLSVPSHQTEIRFFSGVKCNASQNAENVGFAISFKAIPLEPSWSIYTLLSVLIPTAFIILAIAYFCVIMKKKGESKQEVYTLPIPIYVDLDNSTSQVKGKENRKKGLRLRTHCSSALEEPKLITVISSLAEVSESCHRPEDVITPDSSIPVPVSPKPIFKKKLAKRIPTQVNLLNRYPKSLAHTPRYASWYDEGCQGDSHSKSDIVLFDKRKVCRDLGKEIFNFDVLPVKEDPKTQTELETSVFLHSSSGSSADSLPNESISE